MFRRFLTLVVVALLWDALPTLASATETAKEAQDFVCYAAGSAAYLAYENVDMIEMYLKYPTVT